MSGRTVCFVTCPRAELILGLCDATVLHPNQCFTKKKLKTLDFLKKGCLSLM